MRRIGGKPTRRSKRCADIFGVPLTVKMMAISAMKPPPHVVESPRAGRRARGSPDTPHFPYGSPCSTKLAHSAGCSGS